MALVDIRIVIDTNALLRGLAKPESASGQIISAAERRKLLVLTSKPVLEEYRLILLDPEILRRHPRLTGRSVETAIRGMAYLSEHLGVVKTRFDFPRDRRDEKFLALAIEGRASHIVTFDEDLLTLPASHSDAAKRLRQRLPRLRIQMPADFIREHPLEPLTRE